MDKDNFKFILIILFLATFFVLGYLGLTRIDRYFRLKALDDCARIATVSWTNPEGGVITEPFQPVYEKCLNEKGINLKVE